ncbi:hypothetical protein [Nitrobacter winogradskyi]|uniref:Uncharacterized protein n=2 Tax=Nitrobacter winogradskyi TaxID=913 RepID=A0ACC6ADI6_NITWI|nr:hypothetical protein [Nitrobacter winogradskyi]MCP1997878.1 hypothetical protein [Nitrobacter winogradskyi]GEC17540.1 hypothetical protein NWI01_34320 [Nitrobacter winogradskyi]
MQQQPQPTFQTGTTDTGHGIVHSLLDTRTEKRAAFFIRANFAKDTILAGPAAGLYVAVAGGNATIAEATETYSPLALNKHLRLALPAMVRGPFNTFRKTIGEYHKGNETVRIELETPLPETPATRPIRDRAVRLYDDEIAADQMEMATTFGLEQMSGLVAAGALSTLPDDVATIALDRFVALRYAAREGLAAKFPVRETATNPVSMAVDTDAMMADATAYVATMRQNAKLVHEAIQICRDVITWLAVACECSSDEAFAMLTTKPN